MRPVAVAEFVRAAVGIDHGQPAGPENAGEDGFE